MQISQTNTNNYFNHKEVNQISFTSRNPNIRKVDDICRMVMREYPLRSNTKVLRKYQNRERKLVYGLGNRYGNAIRELRHKIDKVSSVVPKMFIYRLNNIMSSRVGNCCEISEITDAACRINGYKNVQRFELYAIDPNKCTSRTLDHDVVGLNFNKEDIVQLKKSVVKDGKAVEENFFSPVYIKPRKAIIVDPWSGITDYASEASKKFEASNLGFDLKEGEKIVYCPCGEIDLGKKDLIQLKYKYPELSLKKKNNCFVKTFGFLLDKFRNCDYSDLVLPR